MSGAGSSLLGPSASSASASISRRLGCNQRVVKIAMLLDEKGTIPCLAVPLYAAKG